MTCSHTGCPPGGPCRVPVIGYREYGPVTVLTMAPPSLSPGVGLGGNAEALLPALHAGCEALLREERAHADRLAEALDVTNAELERRTGYVHTAAEHALTAHEERRRG